MWLMDHPPLQIEDIHCIHYYLHTYELTRKMVPITWRARSFLVFLEFSNREGGQNKNNRPINFPKVITFSTDYNYTT